MEAVADLIIRTIVNNYSAYNMPVWQPIRIKHAISLISEDIANNLDYTNANTCAKSVAKEINVDITPYLVKNKYPVWVDVQSSETFTPEHDNVVITYIDRIKDEVKPAIKQIEEYAKLSGILH